MGVKEKKSVKGSPNSVLEAFYEKNGFNKTNLEVHFQER